MNSLIEKTTDRFIEFFRESYAHYAVCPGRKYDYDPELTDMTDEDIRSILTRYFTEFDGLTQANGYLYNSIEEFVPDTWDQVDHKLDRGQKEETAAYKQWMHHSDVSVAWYNALRECCLEKVFCEIHGKVRTDKEAAKLAADKWCELLFGWHLQDNGALNEDHPGGFTACALGSVLANCAKEKITEEMKQKAHELFVEYYLHDIEYQNGRWCDAIEWAKKALPDPDKEQPYEWSVYSFGGNSMYCDYDPYMPLYLVLVNAGIPEYEARKTCPWKTGIDIRALDNAVMYHTYQHVEEL